MKKWKLLAMVTISLFLAAAWLSGCTGGEGFNLRQRRGAELQTPSPTSTSTSTPTFESSHQDSGGVRIRQVKHIQH